MPTKPQIPVHCAHDKIVPVSQLKPHPGNPNKHPPEQIALLAKIIAAQGWRNPIVVSNRSGLITKGHARREAALSLKCATVPVDYQDYGSESEELADMIADNRIAELAEADRSMLRDLAEQIDDGAFDMDLTGFDHDAFEELMTAAPPDSDIDAEPQIDKAEELRVKWGVERGQIWELGEHRLMCGDSRTDTSKILNGDHPEIIVADPPYGMNLQTDYTKLPESKIKSKTYASVIGDNHDFDPSNFLEQFRSVKEQFWWGGDYFYSRLPHGGSWIVWDKRNDASAGVIGNQFEVCWSKNPHRRIVIRFHWVGFTAHDKGERRTHPTQKPVSLTVEIIKDIKWRVAYDPFSGVGTTIIACEQLGRKCRAMEIDPGYVAVSIQRWADATGKTPRLLNGK